MRRQPSLEEGPSQNQTLNSEQQNKISFQLEKNLLQSRLQHLGNSQYNLKNSSNQTDSLILSQLQSNALDVCNIKSRNNSSSSDNNYNFLQQNSKNKTQDINVFEQQGKEQINFSEDFLTNQSNILKRMQLKVKMKQILKFLPSRMLKQLNFNHLNWLGDPTTYVIEENIKKEELYENKQELINRFRKNRARTIIFKKVEPNQILKFILNVLKKIPIFHPANKFCQIWYFIQLIIINIILIILPMQLVFSVEFYNIITNLFTQFIFILMILDHFIKMNIGYFQKGEVIFSRKKIIKKYLMEHMLDGIIADFSVLSYYWLGNTQHSWVMLLYFFKLRSLQQIERQILEIIEISPLNMNYILLFKLIKNILVVSHYFACVWVQIAYWEKQYLHKWNSTPMTWMDKVDILKNGGWGSQYIAAYYFSSVTMITVGYGDIYAVNEVEMVLCIFTMIIACGLFAYSINQIGFIFEQFGKEQKEKEGNMYIINRYMNQNQISSHFQYQVRQYLEYYWSQTKENYEKHEKEIIGQLSEDLRFQMKQEANRLVLRDTSIFSNNFSQSFIVRLASLIKEITLIPDQKIIQQNNDDDDGSIYFVKKGSLKVILEQNFISQHGQDGLNSSHNYQILNKQYNQSVKQSDKNNEYISLKEGQYFGQVRFFTGSPRNATIITTDFTKLLSIKREDFLNLIKQFPQDYETLIQINHIYYMTGLLQNCGIKCYSCQSIYHSVIYCPLLQYKCDKFKLMLRNKLQESDQLRDPCFVRENQYKSHAFQFLNINQVSKFDFLDSFSFNEYQDDHYGSQEESKKQLNQKEDNKQFENLFPSILWQDSQANIKQENQDFHRRSILNQNQDYHGVMIPFKQGAQQYPSKLKYSKQTSIETQEITSTEDIRKRQQSFQQQSDLASPRELEDNIKKHNDNMIKQSDYLMKNLFQKIDNMIDLKIQGFQNCVQELHNTLQQNQEQKNQFQDLAQDINNINSQERNVRRKTFRRSTTIKKRQGTFILNNNINNSNNNQKNNSQTFIQDQQIQTNVNRNLNNCIPQQNINNNIIKLNSNGQIILQDQQQNPNLIYSSGQIRSNRNIQQIQKQSNYEKKFIELSKFIQQQQQNFVKNSQQQQQNQIQNELELDEIENSFDCFYIFKNFLVHNNIDRVLKKVNDKSIQLLDYYQNQIKLKIILKKRKRQQLKIKKSVLNQLQNSYGTPTRIKERSIYSQKSPHLEPYSLNSNRDKSETSQYQHDMSIALEQPTCILPDSSQRFIPYNKQILTYQFQDKNINSISDIINAANQNRTIQAQFDYNVTSNLENVISSRVDIFQYMKSRNSQLNSDTLSSNLDV